MVIDFVVGDSKGKFDNNNGKDYHIEAAAETDEIVEDNSREAQIERPVSTDSRQERREIMKSWRLRENARKVR